MIRSKAITPRHSRLAFAWILAAPLAACGGEPANDAAKPDAAAAEEAGGETTRGGHEERPAAAKAEDDGWMPPPPIGTVAGEEIDYASFVALYGARKEKAKGKKVGKSVERRSQIAIIDRLIAEQQLRLEAKATGIEYDPAELAASEVEQYIQGEERAQFLLWMGETEETYRERTIADLRERALIRKTADLTVSEQDIEQAYAQVEPHLTSDQERVRSSHIYVAIGPREGKAKIRRARADVLEKASPEERAKWEAEALAKAKALRAEVMASGMNFNEFAKLHSEGPGAYRGEDMGVFDRRRMVKEYTEEVFSMKVGAISEPIKTADGYYVIRLDARHPPGKLSLADIRPDLVRDVENRKFVDARKALRESLEKKYPSVNYIKKKTDG